LLARRENDVSRHGDGVRVWFGGALVAVVGLAAVVSLQTGRILRDRLLKPLGDVVEAMRHIRTGDLDHPMPVVGPPELHELSSAIDEMRRSIVQLLQTEVASRQALEQEAVVTVQLSGSLASTSGDLPTGWQSAAYLRPAEGIVAGDCYVMDLLGPDRIGLAVLDISGHGAAAALTALKAKEIIRSALRSGAAPDRALEMVQSGWTDAAFLTAFVAVINTRRGSVRFANAGHPPALIRTDSGLVPLGATGPILMAPQAQWTVETTSMSAGDTLFVYTDGLTEARNAEREFYGEERLEEMLMAGEAAPQAMIDRCLADMEAFGAGEPSDDLTILVLGRTSADDEPAEVAAQP
jgi:serine phosphatase RsbU (regulator of sigma subunit)